VSTKDQELAEEVVVAMKPVANENVATHLRIKLLERDKTLKAKDGTNNKRRISTFNSCLKVRNGTRSVPCRNKAYSPEGLNKRGKGEVK